jgi:hypothetical protein
MATCGCFERPDGTFASSVRHEWTRIFDNARAQADVPTRRFMFERQKPGRLYFGETVWAPTGSGTA